MRRTRPSGVCQPASAAVWRGKRGPGRNPDRVRPQEICGACRDARRRFPDCIPLNTAAARDGYQVSLSRVGWKRQALSAPSPGEPTRGPACRYLSLKFQTIQSCSLACGPIATAVQPRRATRMCVHVIESEKPLRCSAHIAAARYRYSRFLFHRFCILARPMETPLCKISFLILTPEASTTHCALLFRPLEPAAPSVQQRLQVEMPARSGHPGPHLQRFDRRLSIIYSK